MAKPEPTPPALHHVMRTILNAIISSDNQSGELQKTKIFERFVRWLLGLVIHGHICNYRFNVVLDIRRTDHASQTIDSVSPPGVSCA